MSPRQLVSAAAKCGLVAVMALAPWVVGITNLPDQSTNAECWSYSPTSTGNFRWEYALDIDGDSSAEFLALVSFAGSVGSDRVCVGLLTPSSSDSFVVHFYVPNESVYGRGATIEILDALLTGQPREIRSGSDIASLVGYERLTEDGRMHGMYLDVGSGVLIVEARDPADLEEIAQDMVAVEFARPSPKQLPLRAGSWSAVAGYLVGLAVLLYVPLIGSRLLRRSKHTLRADEAVPLDADDVSARAAIIRSRSGWITSAAIGSVLCLTALVGPVHAGFSSGLWAGAIITILLGLFSWSRSTRTTTHGLQRKRWVKIIAMGASAYLLLFGVVPAFRSLGGDLAVISQTTSAAIPLDDYLTYAGATQVRVFALSFALVPILVVCSMLLRAIRSGGWGPVEGQGFGEVLLLRSFADDKLKIATTSFGRTTLLDVFSPRAADRFSEVAGWSLSQWWPVVAIRNVSRIDRFVDRIEGPYINTEALPFERSTSTADDEAWKERVRSRIADSTQVIAVVVGGPGSKGQLGEPQGYDWEVKQIARTPGALDRTIFLMPPVDGDERRLRWAHLRHLLALQPSIDRGATITLGFDRGIPRVVEADRIDEAACRLAIDTTLERIATRLVAKPDS